MVANGGQVLKEFARDPMRYLPKILGLEFRDDGREIAQIVHDKYFSKEKSYENQLSSFEKVLYLSSRKSIIIKTITF